jgi:hypothetical protein
VPTRGNRNVQCRIDPDTSDALDEAVAKSGLSLSDWLRRNLVRGILAELADEPYVEPVRRPAPHGRLNLPGGMRIPLRTTNRP